MMKTKNAHCHRDLTDEARAKKLAEARARYGKPFVTETLVQRSTEPSFVLREIWRRSQEGGRSKAAMGARTRNSASLTMPISLRSRSGALITKNGISDVLCNGMGSAEEDSKQFSSFKTTRCA